MFEYYEDENSYLVEKEGGLRGSIPTRDIKEGEGMTRQGIRMSTTWRCHSRGCLLL